MWLLVAGTKALLAQLGAIPGFPHAARRHSRSFFFFFWSRTERVRSVILFGSLDRYGLS